MIATLTAVVANANRGKGKPAFRVEQFMPKWSRQSREPVAPNILKHKLMMFVKQHNRGAKVNGSR